jgi:hypothetical protein
MSAASPPQESYAATKVFAVILSVIVAVYGFMGWLNADEPEVFKAILCLVAQGLAINVAIAARRAFAKDKWGHGLGGLILTAGFAFWSEQGLHHAWTLDGSEISPVLTWFLCSVEPVIFWFTESVQLAKAKKTPEEIADETLAQMRGSQDAPAKGSRAHLRPIAGGLAGSLAVAMSPGSQAHEPGSFSSEPSHEPKPMSQKMSRAQYRNLNDPSRAQAKLMIRAGQAPSRVHAETKVPIATLKRWRKEMENAA